MEFTFMKKILNLFLCLLIITIDIFYFTACSHLPNSEISIKYLDDKLYARFDSSVPGSGLSYTSSYMPYDGIISFEEYEKGSESCISRSNRYVRFMLTFNNTPQGYKAIDVYHLNYITLNSTINSKKYMLSREGSKSNEIEILIYLQHMTVSQVEYTINSLAYTVFDSIKGEDVQKTFDLNYNFTVDPIPNFFNRFSNESKFDAVVTECSKNKLNFIIESNCDFDKILYKVDKQGKMQYTSHYMALVKEATMDKAEFYVYESNINEYFWYTEFTVVGYQKDGKNYYTYPMSFSMNDSSF